MWCTFLSKILYELLGYCFLLETLCPFLPEFLLATIRNYFPVSNRLPCSSQKSISRVAAATDYSTTWVLLLREWLKIVERYAHYWNLCFFFINREVIEKVFLQTLLLFSFRLGSSHRRGAPRGIEIPTNRDKSGWDRDWDGQSPILPAHVCWVAIAAQR